MQNIQCQYILWLCHSTTCSRCGRLDYTCKSDGLTTKLLTFFENGLRLDMHCLLCIAEQSAIVDSQEMFVDQVLYGQKCLLQDDFSCKEAQAASSVALGKTVKHRQDQLTVYNAVHAQVEQYAAQLLLQNFSKGLQRWRTQAGVVVVQRTSSTLGQQPRDVMP